MSAWPRILSSCDSSAASVASLERIGMAAIGEPQCFVASDRRDPRLRAVRRAAVAAAAPGAHGGLLCRVLGCA